MLVSAAAPSTPANLRLSQPAAFTSAIVLLLNTWSGKRSGFAYNPSKEMEDVYKCMKMLTVAEKR
jgi:hypothetical protein